MWGASVVIDPEVFIKAKQALRRGADIEELASIFGVTKQGVYRYLEELDVALVYDGWQLVRFGVGRSYYRMQPAQAPRPQKPRGAAK